MSKEGYQPLKTKKTIKIIPPNTGSNIQMKKDGYNWEDLDKAWWEGFDNAKSKMKKRIAELEQENAELKKLKRECETSLCRAEYQYNYEQLTKAKEIIREFMKYEINEYDGSLEIHFEELKKQAEQFLNNEVEND